MSDKKPFYITSTIFYPNAQLHMGHVYTMTICDIISRYQKLNEKEVKFLTGSDENTAKIVKAAEEKNQSVPEFLNEITSGFKKLYADLDIQYDEFVQTTDKEKHWPGAIKMWNSLVEKGDIYKSKYTGLYCPSCEAFYTDKEIVDGKCLLHLIPLEKLEEENYFFKLSKYTGEIKKRVESNELEIVPNTRRNEILALLDRGLEDISFSRPAHTAPHAIPVPNDPEQVMYVWCDALTSYISGIGYGRDEDEFNKYWPAEVHVIGKDILRFHAAIWPAMLLATGLPLPKRLLVHGLITSGGQKMSKSIGNVIDPYELIDKYGAEAVRYYIARRLSLFEDGEMTMESFHDAYNGDLANGLGNLTSRILTMADKYGVSTVDTIQPETFLSNNIYLDSFNFSEYMNHIWKLIQAADKKIQEEEPYKKDINVAREIVSKLCTHLYEIALLLKPVMPGSSDKIISYLYNPRNKKPEEPLFARKDA